MRAVRLFGLAHCRSGASALEFAIVSPVFILILLGLIVYGVYFTVLHGVQQVAAEAARAAIAGLDDGERRALAAARAEAVVETYPFLQRERMQVEAGSDPADIDLFRVTVRYDASHLGLAALDGLIPVPSDEFARASVVRRGGY